MHLEEIVNPIRTRPDGRTFELAFRMSRFRPRTNIDVFLRMLEPQPVRVELGNFVHFVGWKTTKDLADV